MSRYVESLQAEHTSDVGKSTKTLPNVGTFEKITVDLDVAAYLEEAFPTHGSQNELSDVFLTIPECVPQSYQLPIEMLLMSSTSSSALPREMILMPSSSEEEDASRVEEEEEDARKARSKKKILNDKMGLDADGVKVYDRTSYNGINKGVTGNHTMVSRSGRKL